MIGMSCRRADWQVVTPFTDKKAPLEERLAAEGSDLDIFVSAYWRAVFRLSECPYDQDGMLSVSLRRR
jgi:hypothetical protein